MVTRALYSSAEILDRVRAEILRMTMKFNWLRPFFQNRALRLQTLFLISAASALFFSCFAPLWLLLLGPLIWGLPHIFSSLRYFHYSTRQTLSEDRRYALFGILTLATILICYYRLYVTENFFDFHLEQLSEWHGSTFIEISAMLAVFIAGSVYYRKSFVQWMKGILLLSPLLTFYWMDPSRAIGVLVILHNFIAFLFWIRSAEKKSEISVAFISLGVTLGVTLFIFWGIFDPIFSHFHPSLTLTYGSMSVEDTGRLIIPNATREMTWLHTCVAFAFGQALHYFVWLKAIPDQYHRSEVPTSFRQSLSLLENDFGKKFAAGLILSSIGVFGVWSMMSFYQARLVYFSFAAFHGYLEIAGLALIFTRSLPFQGAGKAV